MYQCPCPMLGCLPGQAPDHQAWISGGPNILNYLVLMPSLLQTLMPTFDVDLEPKHTSDTSFAGLCGGLQATSGRRVGPARKQAESVTRWCWVPQKRALARPLQRFSRHRSYSWRARAWREKEVECCVGKVSWWSTLFLKSLACDWEQRTFFAQPVAVQTYLKHSRSS